MPYNSVTDRTDAGPLIPEDALREILQAVPTQSGVLSLARRLPDMSRGQQRMPVLSTLPTAYFVNGDTGLKQTTEAVWSNVYLYAEEVAVVVPIADAVLADADYDIWGELRPRIVEAFGVAIDAAIIHGTNKPTAWPSPIVTAAAAAGNTIAIGTDVFETTLGVTGTHAKVEADGYEVNGNLAHITMKAKLRGLKEATTNRPIFLPTLQSAGDYTLDGTAINFAMNGAIDPAAALMISGDWSQIVYSIRQDVTFRIFTEGVIQDAGGVIVFNLMQMDMSALRVVFRVAWALPNPTNRIQPTAGSRYPLAVPIP